MTILWWHWLVLGLLLLVAEMAASGGFYFIFFGVAAVLIGLLASADMAGPFWAQLLMFSVLSLATLALFRARLLRWLQLDLQMPEVDSLMGEIGVVTEPLVPGLVGKIELRGSSWSARNRGAASLGTGTRCRVVGVDGLMLFVEPEGVR
jgi:membrane protein implicated in regulation of membrane protease activity